MSETERVADHWDGKASSFDGIYSGRKGPLGRLWDKLTRRNIAQRQAFTFKHMGDPEGRRYLDVGCGSGRLSVDLARRGAAEVVGVDVAETMLSLAQRSAEEAGVAERCRFLQGDALTIELEGPFDGALAMGVFDYVLTPAKLLGRMAELTEGIVTVSFPRRWSLRAPARWVWYSLRSHPLKLYTQSEVRSLCEAAGLECLELVRCGPIYILAGRSSS